MKNPLKNKGATVVTTIFQLLFCREFFKCLRQLNTSSGIEIGRNSNSYEICMLSLLLPRMEKMDENAVARVSNFQTLIGYVKIQRRHFLR